MKAINKLPPRWLSTIADLPDAVMLHGPSGELPGANDIIEGVRHADVLISRAVQPVTRKLMMVNPNLRGIANYGVGYNNIDLTAATELGIPVTNTPRVLPETTADLARGAPHGHGTEGPPGTRLCPLWSMGPDGREVVHGGRYWARRLQSLKGSGHH